MRLLQKIQKQPEKEAPAFRLFTTPTFAEGIARMLDFKGQLEVYNTDATAEEADLNALKSDWRAVGEDLNSGINKHHKIQKHG